MCRPDEVPLPYHQRVVSFTEQGEITMEVMDEMGKWMRSKVDKAQFEVMTGGTDVHFFDYDYEEVLLICPGSCDNPTCNVCPCNQPHNSWECGRAINDEHCPDCEHLADEQHAEIDEWFEESHPVLIQEDMPGVLYGDISPRTAAYVTRDLLERGQPFLLFKKFGQKLKNNFGPSKSTSKTLKFRRYWDGKDPEEKKVSG